MSTSSPSLPRTSTAHVTTPGGRAARYAHQLTSHMGRKITTTWDEAQGTGTLTFDRDGATTGTVALTAQEDTLVLTLRSDDKHLAGLEQVTGIHLARFGVKDALAVAWTREDGAPGSTQGPLTMEDMERMRREREARKAAGAVTPPGQ